MTKERFDYLIATLQNCGDITVRHSLSLDMTTITFEDFDGFDDDYQEIDRAYKMPELVEELQDYFDETLDNDFYQEGEVFGHWYCVGYSSFDI